MYYTIYRITNITNGKFYIGKHQTKNLDDGYMGSGKVLKHAITKHGLENFKKEILHVFESEAEMNAKEKELVEIGNHSYNLCPGGRGGFGYINANGLADVKKGRANADKAIKEKYGVTNPAQLEKNKILHSNLMKERHLRGELPKPPSFLGKNHSEESKNKIGEKNKGRIPWNKGKKWLSPGKFI